MTTHGNGQGTLSRRAFTMGAMLTTAAFAAGCGGAFVQGRGLPAPTVPAGEDPIVTALRFGISAPSAHNTQPWMLKLRSPLEAQLFTDPNRLLPLTDPPNRQIHISHGTLLEVLAIAAPSLGYHAEIEILPEGEVTKADYGTKPTAAIRLVPRPDARPDPLFEALAIRRTSRLEHDGPPLTADEVQAIEAAAAVAGVSPRVRADGLEPFLDLIHRAMAVEVAGTETYGETLDWFRFDEDEVLAQGDGLNIQTAGADSLLARLFLTRGNFLSESNRERFLDAFLDVAKSTQGLFTLTTSDNTMKEWIVTGRAYVRGQLAAAQRGLRFHPVSQALQEFPAMAPLRKELAGLVPVPEPGKLQMLVRVGRTEEPAVSPRRKLDAMVVA